MYSMHSLIMFFSPRVQNTEMALVVTNPVSSFSDKCPTICAAKAMELSKGRIKHFEKVRRELLFMSLCSQADIFFSSILVILKKIYFLTTAAVSV